MAAEAADVLYAMPDASSATSVTPGRPGQLDNRIACVSVSGLAVHDSTALQWASAMHAAAAPAQTNMTSAFNMQQVLHAIVPAAGLAALAEFPPQAADADFQHCHIIAWKCSWWWHLEPTLQETGDLSLSWQLH